MAEKKINGRQFQVGEVLATEAIKLQVRLIKIAGGGIDRLPTILAGQGPKATEEQRNEANAAAVGAFTDIFAYCDPEEVTSLIKDMIELAQIKRPSGVWEQADLDGDFTKDRASVIPLVVFVAAEVFGDFFTGLLGPGARAQQIPKSS